MKHSAHTSVQASGEFCRYVWESNASGGYAISEDTEGEQLGRGTQIKLFLKVSFQNELNMP